MAELNWKHHTLIQALLSRGPLMESAFHNIFKGITGKSPVTHQKQFDDYLLKINKALSFVQFELRCCRNQYNGQIFYGVANNISDDQSKMGTKFSVAQIAFYKAIIEAIVQDVAAKGSISNITALNLNLEEPEHGSQSQGGRPALKLTFSQKEKALKDFISEQWLKRTPDGAIELGIRSFLDLRSWFRNNDVPPCEACNEAGVKAELCQSEDCTARIHHYCVMNFFSQRKGGNVCPRCSTEWKFSGPKLEAAEEEEDDDLQEETAESQAPAEPKRKRLRTNKNVSECSSQGSVSTSLLKRVTRSSANAR